MWTVLDYLDSDPDGIGSNFFNPFTTDGQLVTGINDAAARGPQSKGISRATYAFGTQSDEKIRDLLGKINMKNTRANSAGVLKELQTGLGFFGKNITSFLDTPTYRAIRDWKVDCENRKTRDMATKLLNSAIRPALSLIKNATPVMESLLLGTALQESNFFTYRAQTTGGLERGYFRSNRQRLVIF